MSNENLTNESAVNEALSSSEQAAVAASVKRTLAEASKARLAYEHNSLNQKLARKAHLEATGKHQGPGYARCVASIRKTEELIASIESKMNARAERAAAAAAKPVSNQNSAPTEQSKVA